jgi:hypothetical protein
VSEDGEERIGLLLRRRRQRVPDPAPQVGEQRLQLLLGAAARPSLGSPAEPDLPSFSGSGRDAKRERRVVFPRWLDHLP